MTSARDMQLPEKLAWVEGPSLLKALQDWLQAHEDVTLTLRFQEGRWWTDIDLPYIQDSGLTPAEAFERLWLAIQVHQG